MKRFDRVCAGAVLLLGLVHCLSTPRALAGRLWFFGTGLAILFAAMLNLLRIRNGYGMSGLRMFCLAANVTLVALTIAVIVSIGWLRTFANPQVLVLLALLVIEAGFSLGPNQ